MPWRISTAFQRTKAAASCIRRIRCGLSWRNASPWRRFIWSPVWGIWDLRIGSGPCWIWAGSAGGRPREHAAMSAASYRTELHQFSGQRYGRHLLPVDWEKPLYGEPAQDLGHFLAPTTTFWKTDVILTEKEMDGFLDDYIGRWEGRFPTDGLKERTFAYIPITCLRGITWCAMAWVEYQQPGRLLQNASTWKKLNAYLDHGFQSHRGASEIVTWKRGQCDEREKTEMAWKGGGASLPAGRPERHIYLCLRSERASAGSPRCLPREILPWCGSLLLPMEAMRRRFPLGL